MKELNEGQGASTNEVLGRAGDIQIIRPDPSAIPLSEGIHLQVSPLVPASWREQEPKQVLKLGYFSIPVAKVVSEGRHADDYWANVHLNSHPGFDGGVNVFGRNPASEGAWGKPVNIRGVEKEELEEGDRVRLTQTFGRYLPAWENLRSSVALFPDGVKDLSLESPDFKEEAQILAAKNEKMIWANDKFSLVIVGEPHLSGLHLVVHPRDSYWKARGGFRRAWQINKADESGVPEHVQGFLEALSIIAGSERLLIEEEGLPFYNPEIHFSGNWAPDLKKLDPKSLPDDDLERKLEKASHRVGGQHEWQTSMHGHLYATRNPETFVRLPSRPKQEVPDEWEGITPLMPYEESGIRRIAQEKLTAWLIENAKGNI